MEANSTRPFAKVVKRIIEFRQKGSVLDVGTGEGQHALFLAGQGFEVTALDLTDDNFHKIEAEARTQGLSIKMLTGNVLNLSELGASFDIVMCTSVLHFLNSDEVPFAIQQLKEVTKGVGLNVVSAHTIHNAGEVRAHLFSDGELKEYYSDWNILYDWEGLGGPFATKTGELVQRHRAELIAERLN